jgi:hypothetical protein
MAQWAFAGSELSVFIFSTAGFFAGLWFSGQIAKNHFSQQFNPRILEVGSEPID